jgi:hypothetical protein
MLNPPAQKNKVRETAQKMKKRVIFKKTSNYVSKNYWQQI